MPDFRNAFQAVFDFPELDALSPELDLAVRSAKDLQGA
jgi:hypothetical protein